MTGVLSLWTGTSAFRLRRGNMLLATLAANLAARAFKRTHFVTDAFGKGIARELQWPIDYVSEELEHIPKRFAKIWAFGKLVACSIQHGAHIQLDLDVCLLKPLPSWFLEGRLCAQSIDFPHYYESEEMRRALRLCKFHYGPMAYNCGLLGGSDAALVRAYAWAGMDLAERFTGTSTAGTCSSMMIEQFQLGVFAERVGVEVCRLFPLHPPVDTIERLGYVHLTGSAKHKPEILERVENRLKTDFPEAHARFLEAWPSICPEEPTTQPDCSSGGDGANWSAAL